MLVWVTRSRPRTYQITSLKPEWDPKNRYWFQAGAGFRAVLPAAEAEQLLGFELDVGGCVRRELVLVDAPASVGSARVQTTEDTEGTEETEG